MVSGESNFLFIWYCPAKTPERTPDESLFTTQQVISQVEQSQRNMLKVLSYLKCIVDTTDYIAQDEHAMVKTTAEQMAKLNETTRVCLTDLYKQSAYSQP